MTSRGMEFEPVDRVLNALKPHTARAYETCLSLGVPPVAQLVGLVESYRAQLRERSFDEEFLDLPTAERVAAVCLSMVDSLGTRPSPGAHRAVAAAVHYFALEDDAEADNSVIGFDDDLEVAEVTARVLGVKLVESPR